MRIYDNYILVLAASLFLGVFFLALGRTSDLAAYFTVSALIYLAVTLLFVQLNSRARKALQASGVVVFAGLMSLVFIAILPKLLELFHHA